MRSPTILMLTACAALALPDAAAAKDTKQPAREIRGQIDWQAHPAMHIPWKFFGKGLEEKLPKRKLTWRHTFRQTMYAPYLRKSGVRIMMAAAMAAERARNPKQARRLIFEQLRYVEAFVKENAEDFAMAYTPQQARRILTTTNKIVIVHAIEGARKILNGPRDALLWRKRGIALMTVIHLLDDDLGGAALNGGLMGGLLNPKGLMRKVFKPKKRGLTPKGKQSIVWLARAGILVDLTHMSPASVKDALVVTRRHGIPPIVTHGHYAPVLESERSFSEAQVVDIYRQGGYFAIPLGGDFKRLYQSVHGALLRHAGSILGRRVRCPKDLTCAERTRLSVGWASDWNGWTNHTPKPRYTKRELRRGKTKEGLPLPKTVTELDRVGLAHPGLLPQYWERLRKDGLRLEPMLRSPERFLQVWAAAQAAARRATTLKK